jgi:ABC-type uncharacterized transport system ATPase subunit
MQGRLDEIRDAATDRYVEVTTRGDLAPLLNLEGVAVAARNNGSVRLRVPRTTDPTVLLQSVGRDVVRVSYEPPTLSELFRSAVTDARNGSGDA